MHRIGQLFLIFILTLGLSAGCGRQRKVSEPQVPGGVGKEQGATQPSASGPEQALEEYTFSGLSQGTNRWEVKGRSGEIFEQFIKMFDIQAKAFGQEGEVTITSEEGKVYLDNNNVHLEKNVVAVTDDGARLTTDSLDWSAQTETATTEAYVVVEKDNIIVEGKGAEAKTDLKEVRVKEKVKVTVQDQAIIPGQDQDKQESSKKPPTIITCDGKLEIDYENNLAKFFDNVVLDDPQGKVYSDRMDIYIDSKTKTVVKAIALGNVKIEEPGKVSYCQKAIYEQQIKKVTLLGSPRVIIYSTEGEKIAPFGD